VLPDWLRGLGFGGGVGLHEAITRQNTQQSVMKLASQVFLFAMFTSIESRSKDILPSLYLGDLDENVKV